ncbi:MAG: SDR family NAD(P)-dependent oxidoreductase [Pseudomonadota bacterium]
MDLVGRKVLITGGSIGIGRRLATDLDARGAQVLVCARGEGALARLREAHPGIYTFACDVRDYDSVLRLVQYAEQRMGTPDLLINNAAVFRRFEIDSPDAAIDDWLTEVDININGVLRVTHAFLPKMLALEEATLVNVTSPSAYLPLAAAPIYSATKAAIHSWTQSLRHQLRETSLNVVELNPPAVDTRMNHNNPSVADLKLWSTQEFSQYVLSRLQRRDRRDILVGDAKLVRTMSRVAPGIVFKKMNPVT